MISLRTQRRDSGSMSLELAVLAPALLLLIGLLILAGRVAMANGSVEQAAAEAARAASLERSPVAARSSGIAAAMTSLNQQDLQCVSLDVNVTTAGFQVPAGQPASVTAIVTCPVRLSDIAIPGLPGTRVVTAEAASPLDRYRERG